MLARAYMEYEGVVSAPLVYPLLSRSYSYKTQQNTQTHPRSYREALFVVTIIGYTVQSYNTSMSYNKVCIINLENNVVKSIIKRNRRRRKDK